MLLFQIFDSIDFDIEPKWKMRHTSGTSNANRERPLSPVSILQVRQKCCEGSPAARAVVRKTDDYRSNSSANTLAKQARLRAKFALIVLGSVSSNTSTVKSITK